MDRRDFLAGVVGLAGAAAGCLGDRRGDGGQPTDTPGGGTSDDDVGTGTDTEERPRVDEPPYRIERPAPPEDPTDPDDWNALYLCEHMPADPSLPFEQLPGVQLVEPGLQFDHGGTEEAYRVRVIGDEATREDVIDASASRPSARERLGEIDFDEQSLLVVESGFGSGSIQHHWKRLEETDGGLHLFGCHTQPYVYTDDVTARSSAVVVDRPAETFELARVSLTVAEDRRVNFDSTEDVVTVS